jgi:hypothetical protein
MTAVAASPLCRKSTLSHLRTHPPTHPHHVRYAQSRGLSLKASDEFTVPLCAQVGPMAAAFHMNLLRAEHQERL